MAVLVSTVMTNVRTLTDHDTDVQVQDPQLVSLIDVEYQLLRRQVSDLRPDLYMKLSPTFTLTAASNAQDLTASPVSLTDLDKVQSVEMYTSSTWVALEPGNIVERELGPYPRRGRGYLAYGTTVEVCPAAFADGTFRVRYIAAPVAITDSTQTLNLPPGGEKVLQERVAISVRARFEEDPAIHIAQASAAWDVLQSTLRNTGALVRSGLVDVD